MSLLDDYMTDCVMLDRVTRPDAYGGYESVYVAGAPFTAAIRFDSSLEAKIAEKDGVTDLYTITTKRELNLQYHDVFKRLEDGQIFRVTSDGDDNHTPISAGLNMRQVTAEEWVIPKNE